MTCLMSNLQIRFFKAGSQIIKELDETDETLFVMKGKYNVGYEINLKIYMRR